jgi:hypothetical protein
MTVTGHRSRSVFDRYHLLSPADLQEAARKLAGCADGATAAVTGKGTGQVRRAARKPGR